MSAIRESIEISRSPQDVYAYVTDPSHLPEWQDSAVSARPLDGAPLHLGSKVALTRRIGRRRFPMTMQVTEFDPPRSWRLHGLDGPVRGDVRGTIEPLDGGRRSRVTLDLDFEAHGIGRALVPLVVRPYARKEMPRNEEKLKHLLEH
ncbi:MULTISPECIES: SRPBCC family protein [unclassified Streptomyces]|uniref:SRPBCC family protein n=1 Tax=unclassified Streptomyces TaxID=2593676 RepID=UPI00225AAAD2|nr:MULTISPECIES: SRPBCC family protein [unclassified Streptomyces]MCX4528920.1 SRPBCC family protein [Streptomyces sp. NBC_01551]MCX4540409.1 SRPBCC family protein [Streptomyces sp. NBC_01565]